MNQQLLKRAQALNSSLEAKTGKTLLGPDWTPEEERMLGKLSAEAYKLAVDARKPLLRLLNPIMQAAKGDRHKMDVLEEIEKQIQRGNMALNQVGYNARKTYDQRW